MNRFIFLLGLNFLASVAFSKEDYSHLNISLINEKLKINAEKVVRNSATQVVILNKKKAVQTSSEVYTILKDPDKRHTRIVLPYDSFKRIQKWDATILDSQGKVIKNFNTADFVDIAYFSNVSFMDDTRLKILNISNYKAPYTVILKYEYEILNMLVLEDWYPINDENLSIEKTELELSYPSNFLIRYKEYNYDGNHSIDSSAKGKKIKWKLNDIPSVLMEPYSDFVNELPRVKVSAIDFEVEGYSCSMGSWQGFGEFIGALNKDRQTLPPDIKEVVKNIKASSKDQEEIIKKLYKYLQDNTRYVGIQLGLGGYQPFDAAYVGKNKFGDCKALSNFMLSLLKEAGIPSYYTLVNAGDDASSIDIDFPGSQFNHIILFIPQVKDTIWLECTSQNIPFAQTSTFTDSRSVLVIDNNASKVIQTPVLDYKNNYSSSFATCKIDSNTTKVFKYENEYAGEFFDNRYNYYSMTSNEIKEKYLKSLLNIHNFSLSNFNYRVVDSIGALKESFTINIPIFLYSSSNKSIIKSPFIFDYLKMPKAIDERKFPFYLQRNKVMNDTLVLEIMPYFGIEELPKDKKLSYPFGDFYINYKLINNKIIISRRIILKKGKYPKENYNHFREFISQINTLSQRHISLSKN